MDMFSWIILIMIACWIILIMIACMVGIFIEICCMFGNRKILILKKKIMKICLILKRANHKNHMNVNMVIYIKLKKKQNIVEHKNENSLL